MKGHNLYKHFSKNRGERKSRVIVTIYGPIPVAAFGSWHSGISFSHFLSVFTHHSSRISHAYYFVNKTSVVFTKNTVTF